MIRIVFLGASLNWVPRLLTDLLVVFPEPLAVWFVDLDPGAAEACRSWGEEANRVFGRRDEYRGGTDRQAALRGADAVLVTLSTGGFPAMALDLSIPEAFGLYATVGDTCGPSGWSRAIRNIPVFEAFADDFEALCPKAMIVNYSNPMAALTSVLLQRCGNPAVGLCHAVFETRDVLAALLPPGTPDGLQMEFVGMNHFTWVTGFTVDGENGYERLDRRLSGRSLLALLPEETEDEIGFSSGHRLCAELFDLYRCMPYPADRHTVEFLPWGTGPRAERRTTLHAGRIPYEELVRYRIRRTAIVHREAYRDLSLKAFRQIWDRKAGDPPPRSRETGADMIRAYLLDGVLVDAVNALNAGQAPQLAAGACVETLGVVDRTGVRPLPASPLPDPVAELVRPVALAQKWLVDGMLGRDPDLALQALRLEPQATGLSCGEIRELYDALVAANRPFGAPAFLEGRRRTT